MADEAHESLYHLQPLTFEQCRSLMIGTVPPEIRETCRSMIEWMLQTGDVSYEGLNRQYQRQTHDKKKKEPTCDETRSTKRSPAKGCGRTS